MVFRSEEVRGRQIICPALASNDESYDITTVFGSTDNTRSPAPCSYTGMPNKKVTLGPQCFQDRGMAKERALHKLREAITLCISPSV